MLLFKFLKIFFYLLQTLFHKTHVNRVLAGLIANVKNITGRLYAHAHLVTLVHLHLVDLSALQALIALRIRLVAIKGVLTLAKVLAVFLQRVK